jgi:hypothetical protein
MLIGLIDGFGAWWERYKDQWNGGFFAGASGGCEVLTVAEENELNRTMAEWPLNGFTTIETHAPVDIETAFGH